MNINMRGTSGSGKTTLARHFMELCSSVEPIIPAGQKKPEAYRCIYKGETVYLLGSYESLCGGCDTVKPTKEMNTQERVCELIENYEFEGHILFESLFASHIYERYASLARADIDNWVFFMLDTDFDTCMKHIQERRVKQGRNTELKDSVFKNAKRTYDTTYRIREKFTAEGITWENLPMRDRFNNFEGLLDFYLGV